MNLKRRIYIIITLLVLLVGLGGDTGRVAAGSVQRTVTSRGLVGLHAGDTGSARGEALGSAHAGTLHGKSLAHDRAAAAQNLKVGHSAAAGAGTSGRGERAQSGGRGALEEGAHGPRLLEHCLHGESN